jgi:hypothetical protein
LRIAAVFLLTLVFSTLSLVQLVVAEVASGTLVEVEPYASFANVGEIFSVNVTVVNVQNLYGVGATLYWNASVLEINNTDVMLGVESHQNGILHEPIDIYQNQTFQAQGKYVLAGSSTAPAPSFNGSGTMVRLTFRAISVGSCTLSLETDLASNIIPQGSTSVAPIQHTTVGGFFGPFIQINVFPSTINLGQTLNISGIIAPVQTNVKVTILFKHDEETVWHTLEDITTDSHGSYQYTWKPQSSGKYYVESSAVLLGLNETSSIASVSVNESGQFAWLYPTVLAAIIIIAVAILLTYRKNMKTKRH